VYIESRRSISDDFFLLFFFFFFSSFFTPALGGDLVDYEAKLATFFRDTVRIPQILESFSDIRMHPRIRLRDILMCVFLMPVWGMSALLRLDYHLRTPKLLRLFRCPQQKKVVVSDTTIARVLRWIDPQQSSEALFAPCSLLNAKDLLQRRLMPKGPSRRLAVFDGSQMGDHYLVAALLCGKINYPVLVQPCKGRGHELKSTQQWLPLLHQRLGPAAPELWLFDALYFNSSTFTTVRNLHSHLLIKYSPDEDDGDTKLFRDVLEDAKALFAVDSPAIDPVEQENGFDSARWCSWSMKKTSAEFAGYPLTIFFLVEDYPKRKKNAHVETWIVTTDLTLDCMEGRESAHLRWHIENNEFKRLSHLAGTKTHYFKDQRQFFALLRLFCLALTVFDAFFYILRQTQDAIKSLMQGCKFTWKSAFSQLGWLEEDAFEYLVTAGR
jgi:hypothetical protein